MLLPPNHIAEIIAIAASTYNVPAPLLTAVAYVESRYNPKAESSKGAKGLMQIMPVNYESLEISDPFDAKQSANGAAMLLAKLKSRFGTWESALAAYNWGSGNVKANPDFENWPESTKRYVTMVLEESKKKTRKT